MQKLTYINSRGLAVTFGNSAPFILSRLEGTGGVDTNIQTTKAPYQDGSTIHGITLENRAIVMDGYVKGSTREDMYKKRHMLASVLNPKLGAGTLIYQNNYSTKMIQAIPEESPIFTERSANYQKFTVTLICPQPFWLDEYESKEEIAVWMGDLEFDFEITEDGIDMGHRENSQLVNIVNLGDVTCGMRIEMIALASVVSPILLDVRTQEFIKVKRTLQVGDKLTISTYFGNKRVELVRNGVTSNVFNYIDLSSTFLQLDVGDNLLRYDADVGMDNLEVSVYYRPQYVGV